MTLTKGKARSIRAAVKRGDKYATIMKKFACNPRTIKIALGETVAPYKKRKRRGKVGASTKLVEVQRSPLEWAAAAILKQFPTATKIDLVKRTVTVATIEEKEIGF